MTEQPTREELADALERSSNYALSSLIAARLVRAADTIRADGAELSRLRARVDALEGALRSFDRAFSTDFVMPSGEIVDSPEKLWSPLPNLWRVARAALEAKQ